MVLKTVESLTASLTSSAAGTSCGRKIVAALSAKKAGHTMVPCKQASTFVVGKSFLAQQASSEVCTHVLIS